jgi:hypothetical protein
MLRSTATLTNRGGVAYTLVHPVHEDLSNYAVAALNQFRQVKRDIIADQNPVIELVIHPKTTPEFELQDAVRPPYGYQPGCPIGFDAANEPSGYWDYTAGAAVSGIAPGVILISGAPAGMTFDGQLDVLIEYAGQGVNYLSTPTPSDLVGLGKALALSEMTTEHHVSNSDSTTRRADHAPTAVATVAADMLPIAGDLMTKSGNPYMQTAGLAISELSRIVPKKTMARGFDEIGSAFRHLF